MRNNNVINENHVAPRFDLNWNEPRSKKHVTSTLGRTGPITQDKQQLNLVFEQSQRNKKKLHGQRILLIAVAVNNKIILILGVWSIKPR